MNRIIFPILSKRLGFFRSYFFSNTPNTKDHIHNHQTIFVDDQNVQKEELKLDPIATSLEEYKKAMAYFHKGDYKLSQELFKRTLDILESSQQKNSETSIHILKKFILLAFIIFFKYKGW